MQMEPYEREVLSQDLWTVSGRPETLRQTS